MDTKGSLVTIGYLSWAWERKGMPVKAYLHIKSLSKGKKRGKNEDNELPTQTQSHLRKNTWIFTIFLKLKDNFNGLAYTQITVTIFWNQSNT